MLRAAQVWAACFLRSTMPFWVPSQYKEMRLSQSSITMTEAEERQGETEQSVASTSGIDGTVQRLRELRVSDRPCVTQIPDNMMQGAQKNTCIHPT